MADYGGVGGGQSLRDALNQLYPLTNLGGISTGYPPQMYPPDSGGPQPEAGLSRPPLPGYPVPQPGLSRPPLPGGPVPPQPGLSRPPLPGGPIPPGPPLSRPPIFQGQQGPPNYAAQLGFQQWRNNPGLDQMVVPPFGLPPDRNTIDPNVMMPYLQQYRRAGQENI